MSCVSSSRTRDRISGDICFPFSIKSAIGVRLIVAMNPITVPIITNNTLRIPTGKYIPPAHSVFVIKRESPYFQKNRGTGTVLVFLFPLPDKFGFLTPKKSFNVFPVREYKRDSNKHRKYLEYH